MANKLGHHVQTWTDQARGTVRAAPGAVLKVLNTAVDRAEIVRYKQARPDGIVIFRNVFDVRDQSLGNVADRVNRTVAAMASIADLVDYVETPWNEVYQNGSELTDYATASVVAVHLLKQLGRWRVLVGNFSVGNPPGVRRPDGSYDLWADWQRFLPALRAGDGLSLHEYGAPSMQSGQGDYCLRYRHVWALLPADCRKDFFITENGFDFGVIPGQSGGYQAHGVPAAACASGLHWYASEVAKDDFVKGVTVFECGAYPDFASFDYAGEAEIEAVFRETFPGGPPMPEPDYPNVIWEPSPNFGYPTRGTHGRKDPATGVDHRVVALVMHIEQGTESATDFTFDSDQSQVAATVSNPRAAVAHIRQHVHDDDAPWANGIDTSLGASYWGSDVSLAWLMDCFRKGTSVNIVTRSMEHEGLSGQDLTPEQYQRTLAWCVWQFRKEGWQASEVAWRIVGHFQINRRDKSGCPGPGFPMAQLRADVAAALSAKAAAFDVGPLAAYLAAHSELGAPRMNAWQDPYGDSFVYVTPTPSHPKGPMLIYRHSTGEIDLAFA